MSMRFSSKMALRRILHGFKCRMSMKLSEKNVQFPQVYDLPDRPISPRSSDLSTCDFYLWGNLKGRVYSNNPHTIEELKTNIHNAIAEITPKKLAKVAGNMLKRAELCIQVHGEQFQHLL